MTGVPGGNTEKHYENNCGHSAREKVNGESEICKNHEREWETV